MVTRLSSERMKVLIMDWLKTLTTYMERLLENLYKPEVERGFRWLPWAWITALYLGGALLWGKFFNWGRIPFDYLDWAEVWAPRLHVVRDALLKGVLPLHLDDAGALRNLTDRFFSIADVAFTPQMVLLRFMEIGPFILVNTLFLYTIALLGLLWLRRRFGLSLAAFSVLFLLFNFNGSIQAHLAVGHPSWWGYLLFPLLVVQVVQLLDGEHSWWWSTRTAMLLFIIWLQGGFHQYVWALMFLGLLAVVSWKHIIPLMRALVGALVISAWRILPPILIFQQVDTEFLGGYPTAWELLKAMVVIIPPEASLEVRSNINLLAWWELDLYIGLVGCAFLLYFGLYRWIGRLRNGEGYPELLLPVAAMVLLSIGRIYRLVMLLPVPLLTGERVSARMVLMPLVFLLVMGAVEFQRWISGAGSDRESGNPRAYALHLAGLGALLVLAHDLWQHIKLWQVTNVFQVSDYTPRDLSLITISNHADPIYTTILTVGAVLTLLGIVGMLLLSWRERKQKAAKRLRPSE
jgi:hypothetical protein